MLARVALSGKLCVGSDGTFPIRELCCAQIASPSWDTRTRVDLEPFQKEKAWAQAQASSYVHNLEQAKP